MKKERPMINKTFWSHGNLYQSRERAHKHAVENVSWSKSHWILLAWSTAPIRDDSLY